MLNYPQAVLFDLDGTLLDTAPDLAAALNHVRASEKLPPLPYEEIRRVASDGARGLLRLGLGIENTHEKFSIYRENLLNYYAANIAVHTRLFSGMGKVLRVLERKNIPWGIVTNKPAALSQKLLSELSLHTRTACLVGGDTLPQQKPHPAPLLYAAQQLNVLPQNCWYIGDAERDITAGKVAGMRTIAALYGYLHHEDDALHWQADTIINVPEDLLLLIA